MSEKLFKNFQSIINYASIYGFRTPKKSESKLQYRKDFSDFMRKKDSIKAEEILLNISKENWTGLQKIQEIEKFIKMKKEVK